MVPEIEVKTLKIKANKLTVEAEKPMIYLNNSFTTETDATGFLHIRRSEDMFKLDDVRITLIEENIYIFTKSLYSKRSENEPRKS